MLLPQETGNHEDTRWAAICGTEAGNGIYVTSIRNKEFTFGALHYTQEDLTHGGTYK